MAAPVINKDCDEFKAQLLLVEQAREAIGRGEDLAVLKVMLHEIEESMPVKMGIRSCYREPVSCDWAEQIIREFVKRDDVEAVDFLLSQDAWKSGASQYGFSFGRSLLDSAVDANSVKCLKYLVSKKEDTSNEYLLPVDKVHRAMSLEIQLSRPDFRCFRTILDSGRLGNFQHTSHHRGPLLHEVIDIRGVNYTDELEEVRQNYVKILLDEYSYPANQELTLKEFGWMPQSFNAFTLLEMALEQYGLGMFDLLVSKGVDPHTTNLAHTGETLLHRVITSFPRERQERSDLPVSADAERKVLAVVCCLVEKHELNAAQRYSDENVDAFFLACVENMTTVARYLQKQPGVDVNIQDARGRTVLHLLVAREDLFPEVSCRTVEFLVNEAHSAVDVKDTTGRTAYDIATQMWLNDAGWYKVLKPVLQRAQSVFTSIAATPFQNSSRSFTASVSRDVLGLVWNYAARGLVHEGEATEEEESEMSEFYRGWTVDSDESDESLSHHGYSDIDDGIESIVDEDDLHPTLSQTSQSDEEMTEDDGKASIAEEEEEEEEKTE